MFSMEVTIIDGAVLDLFLEAAVADLLEAVHDVPDGVPPGLHGLFGALVRDGVCAASLEHHFSNCVASAAGQLFLMSRGRLLNDVPMPLCVGLESVHPAVPGPLIKEVQNATFPLYGGLAFHKCLLHFAGWAGGGSSDKGGEKEDLHCVELFCEVGWICSS